MQDLNVMFVGGGEGGREREEKLSSLLYFFLHASMHVNVM